MYTFPFDSRVIIPRVRISEELTIAPGEIWAVTGADAAARSAWCAALARRDELAEHIALLSFAQQAGEASRTGWPQARYYEEGGKTVADFLSYEEVYEINPFEVGARRSVSRAAYRAHLGKLRGQLGLSPLWTRQVIALSNGETRRVLLARALAKAPRLLILDDPAAGLDVRQRARLKELLAALACSGVAILLAYRHADELPPQVTAWLKVNRCGTVRRVPAAAAPTAAPRPMLARRSAGAEHTPPVVEIRHLNVTYGDRALFTDFSWTIRRGERWILRGENGSGKTTLMALITGDSPLAYAADITVFGLPRVVGVELAKIRSRIGMVSPEQQAYLGKEPLELLDEALAGRPDLLLLDEPFMNLDAREAKRAARKIAAYLRAHRTVTAILICHRSDEAPDGFTLERELNG